MDAKLKLQKEYEKLIASKWHFLNNNYKPVIKKNFHRTELQDIERIEEIKQVLYDALGVIPVFIFITDFCNNFNIPGPYKDIDKAIIILYHLIVGVSINQMETYLSYANFSECINLFT